MNRRRHAAKPRGIGGRRVLNRMNGGAHAELSQWGLSFLNLPDYKSVLEIGCGGGANVARLLAGCRDGHVTGVDYSDTSVHKSTRVNADAIRGGRCEIRCENVQELSFDDKTFDLATAFETIYFWPDIDGAFAQVFRVLADGGMFFICNETDGDDPEGYTWTEDIENMKIYKESELVARLRRAGFTVKSVERNPERHWICFLAVKENSGK